MNKNLLYGMGLVASFVLGLWFAPGGAPVAPPVPVSTVSKSETRIEQPAPSLSLPTPSRSEGANVYVLVATDPRAALEEAMKQSEATRLATMQDLMAVWLRKDRLAAAEWMTEKRGLREFEPLSAQVSDAFFPDDTEMSAMFSFDLTDASMRDVRVNRLVAYWKSGAHLKFDNSPWEVDGPGTGPAKPVDGLAPQVEAETTVSETTTVGEASPVETKAKG